MKRRNFIQNSAIVSASMMMPEFIADFKPGKLYNTRSGKNLVVVQLSGGNDGLNTIIPYQNDLYYKARKSLAIEESEVLKVSDQLGFHPALEKMRAWYEGGYMTIVNGVGYPNPDRSHFRSMDIWHTGSPSNEYWSTGWLGRYLDNNCEGCESPHYALQIGNSLNLSLKGNNKNGFALTNPDQLKKTASNDFLKLLTKDPEYNENTAYLYKTLIDTQQSADYIFKKSRTYKAKTNFPKSPIAKQLKLIAELLTADLDSKIYYAELGGFDTHANQKNTQQRLLKFLAEALDAFLSELKNNNLLDDTLIMVFSEFGRRVKQNGSNGTDHGTANNLWLFGGNLKNKGFYNDLPSLSDLDNGDLKYTIDFRNIYADILKHQLDTDPEVVLSKAFESLNII